MADVTRAASTNSTKTHLLNCRLQSLFASEMKIQFTMNELSSKKVCVTWSFNYFFVSRLNGAMSFISALSSSR